MVYIAGETLNSGEIMTNVWDMYQDLLIMYGTKDDLEREIARVMADPTLILPSENPNKAHDRLEAIFYLHVRILQPMWLEIGTHPPPRAAKKSWL